MTCHSLYLWFNKSMLQMASKWLPEHSEQYSISIFVIQTSTKLWRALAGEWENDSCSALSYERIKQKTGRDTVGSCLLMLTVAGKAFSSVYSCSPTGTPENFDFLKRDICRNMSQVYQFYHENRRKFYQMQLVVRRLRLHSSCQVHL